MHSALLCGEAFVEVDLPDDTDVLSAGRPLGRLADPVAAARQALAAPIGGLPIRDRVGRGSKVVVAFADPCIPTPPVADPDPRHLIIPLVLDDLEAAGVAPEDVRAVCASGLHQRWSRDDIALTLGDELTERLGERLSCHDAEDPDGIVHVADTPGGMPIEVNRAVVDADLVVYVGMLNITMNGGWSSVVIGLSTYRSIRHHHSPDAIMADHGPVTDPATSPMLGAVREAGHLLQKELGPKFLQIEAVLTSDIPYGIAGIFAGQVDAAHEPAVELAFRQQNIPVAEPYDVVVLGVPDLCPYANLAGMNPILVHTAALGYGFHLYRHRPLVRKGGAIVMANPLTLRWDTEHHPSYRPFWDEVLSVTRDPHEIRQRFEDDFATRPGFIESYRAGGAYHGAHPVFAYTWGAHATRYATVHVAPVEDGEVARRLDYVPYESVADALEAARASAGPRTALMTLPPLFGVDVGRRP